MALLKSTALVCLLSACGLIGSEGGGSEGLPIAGGGPYARISDPTLTTKIDEPFVVNDSTHDLTAPSAIALGDGWRVFYTRTPHAGGASEIWYTDLGGLHDLPIAGPTAALVATQSWESGSVSAASIQDEQNGNLFMVYQGGTTGDIGTARSTDCGVTWTKLGMLRGNAVHPSMLELDGHTYLYYAHPGASGIFLATSDDSFVAETQVLATSDITTDFDRAGVTDPTMLGGHTTTGQSHFGLFYVGSSDKGGSSIGYAGSLDGVNFSRGNQGKAALLPLSPNVRGPTVVPRSASSVMFFAQVRAGVWGIAAAQSP